MKGEYSIFDGYPLRFLWVSCTVYKVSLADHKFGEINYSGKEKNCFILVVHQVCDQKFVAVSFFNFLRVVEERNNIGFGGK